MGITEKQIEKSVAIAKAYGVKRLILFGSALEEPERARDIDLACDGIDGWKLFEFGGRLEEELHLPVDIVPLNPPTRFSRYIEARGKILL
ncbi:MAG TPA: nucleotidyltransferase domain-containing protein [Candidatus Brocadiales bacterium]|nr:nucleotidyltransferase domain-containing protein [Candidatus Brocadiales bacterium]